MNWWTKRRNRQIAKRLIPMKHPYLHLGWEHEYTYWRYLKFCVGILWRTFLWKKQTMRQAYGTVLSADHSGPIVGPAEEVYQPYELWEKRK